MFQKFFFILCLFVFSCMQGFCAEGFTVKKMSTGQTVIVKEVPRNPIVTIDTWIRTGSIDEDDKTSGIAHFLEHLFFKGTQNNPAGIFDKLIESKGGITNAATSKDFTHYYITIPSQYFDQALSLHADMLLNPMIPRKELEKERLVVLEEISKNLDSPQSVMSNNLFKIMYEGHPYARPVIGSDKIIETVTREEILEFYGKNYTPAAMTTVIVGDVKAQDSIKAVEKYFQNDEARPKMQQKKYPKIKPIQKQARVIEKKNVETAYMTIAYRTKKAGNNKDIYALDVLSAILGECVSSRLNQNLKEQKELVYSISTASGFFKEDGFFTVQATFKPKNIELVENAIYEEIEDLKQGGITKEELFKAKNIIKTQSYYDRESITNIAGSVGYLSVFFDNTRFYDNYIKNIERIGEKDVIKVAKKYLINNKNAVSIVIPEKFDFKDVAKKSEIKQTDVAKNDCTLQKMLLSNKNYDAKIVEQNTDTTKYILRQGETVIIRKNSENSIVAIDINALGGNFIEKIPTTASLMAKTVKDGTKNYSGETLSRFLDERGINLSFSASNDTFGVSLLATKNELQDAFALLNEVINNAVFEQKDIDKNKKLITAAILRLKDNPLSLGVDTFKAEAFSGMVYGNNSQTILENIGRVQKEDIIQYYNTVFVPQNLVISVVGDVDDKEILNYLGAIFEKKVNGNIKKINMKEFKKNIFKPQKNIEKTVKKADVNTSWLLLGYKICDMYDAKDRATLRVINAILGDGMSSRMFKNLRDTQGLAYAVGSSDMQNMLDGVFLTYIGTSPEKVEIAKSGILEEINVLKTEYVSSTELKEAKDKILGNLSISLETNMDEAILLNRYGVLGRDINYLEKYKETISNVSQSDILGVANKYFGKPYIFTVVKP